jgi:3-oxoacyl-[acyl-carrier protein] reductase
LFIKIKKIGGHHIGMRLKNKISLVTGASRGIGRAIALTFAREGSEVIVNYTKSKDKADDVVKEIMKMGRKAIAIQADVANKDEVTTMVDEGLKAFGRIDILVNNAGISWRVPNILEGSKENWEKILGVNLLGPYYCIQAVAPHMISQKYGKIINISSIGGIGDINKGQVSYAPAKAALIMLTKKLAYEIGLYNINVNAIAPGLTKTDMPSMGRTEEELKAFFKEKAEGAALKRVGEPEEIANVALFLASDESSFVTGQVIVADGGGSDYLSHSI